MAMNFEELAAEAMNLALEERTQLASRLLLSLEEPSGRRLRSSGLRRLNGV